MIIWSKFTQNGYSRSKTENVNITIEFCIFKLVYLPNFSLNWQFWYFGQTLPILVFLVYKRKSALREKCPNKQLFLVRIFHYSDWIRTRKNCVFEHFSRSASLNSAYLNQFRFQILAKDIVKAFDDFKK